MLTKTVAKIKQKLGKRRLRVAAMSALFFLAMMIFWILKPIKKGVFISHFKTNGVNFWGMNLGGAEAEQLAKITVVIAALIFSVLLGIASRYYPLRKIFLFTTLSAAAGIVFFAARISSGDGWLVWALYIFADVQNSLVIVLVWSLLHNSFRVREAKCVYGFVGLGGVAGGLVGTVFVHQALPLLGRETVVLSCVVPMLLIILVGYKYSRGSDYKELQFVKKSPPKGDLSGAAGVANLSKNWRAFGKSKYWIAVGLLVALYEATSGIIDFQLSAALEHSSGGIDRDVYFAFVGMAQNVVAVVIQMFFSGQIIRRWGLETALLVLPVTILCGSLGFLLAPTLGGAMFLSVSDNGLNYSLNQHAKETLYVPTEPEERLRAKAFIDVFVQRFAKASTAVLNLAIVTTASWNGVRWLSLAAIPLLILWIATARVAGREFEQLSMVGASQ
jgi:AAA family ATP:ADP antiporter